MDVGMQMVFAGVAAVLVGVLMLAALGAEAIASTSAVV